MRINLLNWYNLVSISKKLMFCVFGVVKFVHYDLSIFLKKNLRQLFDKYAVARTEHDAIVKSTTKIFSNFVAFSENPNFKKS